MNKPSIYGFLIKMALISTLLIGQSAVLFSQWEAVYFDNSNFPELQTVAFSNNATGLAAGDNGVVIRTSNSGLNWETVLNEPNNLNFVDITFVTPTTAFVIGQNENIGDCGSESGVITRTKNYGATWESTYLNTNLYASHFPTINTGFAVGSCGAVYKTVNSGDSWQLLNTPTTNGLTTLHFIDELNGFVAGTGNVLLSTEDGGDSWTNIDLPGNLSYQNITFVNATTGYLLTNNKLFKTVDAGNTWTEDIDLPSLSLDYLKMFWVDENIGWVASTSTISKTNDGGDSWVLQGANTSNSSFTQGIEDLFFLDGINGYVVGTQGYFKTTTGGESLTNLQYLNGNVFKELGTNCDLDINDLSLEGWIVSVYNSTDTYYATSDFNGDYSLVLPTGVYDATLILPNKNWIHGCDEIYSINLSVPFDTLIRNFPVKEAISNCPVLEVDISTEKLTHCADNTYTVYYRNRGTATAIAPFVEVTLDEDLTMMSSNWSSVLGNVYTFDLDDVDPESSGSFSFDAFLECNSIVGQAHAVQANIYPDAFCLPSSPLWDGGSIAVESICISDSVSFTIKNIGSGDTGTQGFVIIEDHILMSDGDVDLGPGEDTTFTLYPQGTTLRLEVEQVSNHPGRSNPSRTYEACAPDGNGNYSLGYVNQLPEDDANIFVSIDAQESTASAVTTNKRAYPKGYGDEHFIEANVDLDYHILFENNTTDTVYTVIVQDTLSQWFNASSIRQGAASHEYEFDLSGNGIATFTFTDVFLAPGEKGFIKFRIQQKTDNPIGSFIENTACISYDYGLNNKTNTTIHEVGTDFISEATAIQISGSIMNENGEAVALAEIQNNAQSSTETDDYGAYLLDGLTPMSIYTIRPSKNINLLNGVDAGDLYLMQQHVVGNIILDSSYKLLAADVNHSGSVTMMDVLNTHQALLLLIDEFPNNSAWRFIKEPYDFANATNPFAEIFTEAFSLHTPLLNNEINFTGVKIGDVDNSHDPLGLIGEEAEVKEEQTLLMNDLRLEKGKQYKVPVTIEAADALAAIQFALQLDQTAISFDGVETDATTICRSDNFGYRFLRAGVITACWFDQNAVELNQPNQSSLTTLFHLRFTAQKDGLLSSYIALSPEHVDGLAFERKEDLLTKELKRKLTSLQFNTPGQTPTKVRPLALEIFPNPASDNDLWLNYSLHSTSNIRIRIHNTLGQPIGTILSLERRPKGTYTYKWNTSGLPEGSYFIRMEMEGEGTMVRKFLKGR